jgi:hypothetical protein
MIANMRSVSTGTRFSYRRVFNVILDRGTVRSRSNIAFKTTFTFCDISWLRARMEFWRGTCRKALEKVSIGILIAVAYLGSAIVNLLAMLNLRAQHDPLASHV